MLQTNVAQREYYENADGYNESPLNTRSTNIWRRMRRNAYSVFKNAEIQKSVVQLHRQWMGDVSNAKVLDLGLGQGNPLSLQLAREAREYVAIDLSSTRMDMFRTKLREAGIQGAKTYVADFLSDEFPERGFDIVYAMSVFHHFEHIDAFLDALSDRMSVGGIAITQDPLQTWLPMKLMRLVYHRLQTGGAWEFPFTRDSLEIIERKFKVEHVQGIYGDSKWAIPISIFSPEIAKRFAQRWHLKDLRDATNLNAILSCLRVSFMLRKQ
jgi:2-polyprenyl-3-methyl-5-hydroxy-6-metoxy-1,4-benzoquinol methylase